MERIKSAVFLPLLLFLIHCATTDIRAIRNQEIPDIKLRRLLVIAPFKDIGIRQDTEGSFSVSLKSYLRKFKIYGRAGYDRYKPVDVVFLRSIDILPPFKMYNDSDVAEKLREQKIEGILAVALEDYWTAQTYVPRSSETTGEFKIYGGSLQYESYTKESGGYYISKPRVKFEIRLYDVASGEILWMATSATKGNAFANYDNLIESLSMKILEELVKEDIITKQKE